MAKNTNNRIPVKWVRDRAKSAYVKADECAVCSGSIDLELHHTHSVTLLLEKWATTKNYDISTDEGICEVRDEFIDAHRKELYDDVFTLCNKHHMKLHSIFGKTPRPGSEARQALWIDNEKARYDPKADKPAMILGSFFSEFTK